MFDAHGDRSGRELVVHRAPLRMSVMKTGLADVGPCRKLCHIATPTNDASLVATAVE